MGKHEGLVCIRTTEYVLCLLPCSVRYPPKISSTASPNNSNTTQRILSMVSEKKEKTIVALRDFTSLFMNDTG